MKKLGMAAAILVAASIPAIAQPAAGPAKIMSSPPTGKTINDFYKQSVYDPSKTKIGSVDDMVMSDNGQVTALIVGVGGFIGMGEKDVAVPFDAVRPAMKDGAWYLTMDATKDQLKAAPGVTYDKAKTAWVAEKK
ncbi:MAG: PRC-barrel domain-containing protein [Alphaproteobacteria bacterium]|nr:PRC-barrel domain-containing protein [Alphaproteobacteria bacterium]